MKSVGTTSLVLSAALRPTPMIGALPLALLLSACAVGPDYREPGVTLPPVYQGADWAQAAGKPQLLHWWTRLNDPQLNALIDDAVQGNLDVEAAKARVREARATYRQAGGSLLPALDGKTAAMRSKSSGANAQEAAPATEVSTRFQAGLDASWELDLFGKNRRGMEAAFYGVGAANEQLRLALLTLVGDIATNYVSARGYQARIALAESTARTQRETADLTRRRFQAGAASAVDVANATGQAFATEAQIPSLAASYAEAVHRLGVLTGQAPGSLTDKLKRRQPIPVPKWPMPVGIPADTLLMRPDVKSAERQLAQATAKIGQAEAAKYPTISLTGSIATTGLNVGDLAKGSSIGWSFGPSISVPLFKGGQLQAAVDASEAQRDQYLAAYRKAVLTSLEDVENALVGMSQESLRYRKLAASVEAYRQAATLSRKLYEGGSSDFLTILDSQRSLYGAQDALVQSKIALATNYVALNKALGGGWDGALDASNPKVADGATPGHAGTVGIQKQQAK